MGSSTTTEGELDVRTRQQAVVAELGQQAVETDDLDQLLDDAAAAVAEGLDVAHSDVLELLPEGNGFLVRGGVDGSDATAGGIDAADGGSEAATCGSEATAGASEPTADGRTVPVQDDSLVGTTLDAGEPVVVDDLRADDRHPEIGVPTADDAGSGVSVLIGSSDDPWGVLEAHDAEQRSFTESDVHFVQSVANVLGTAVEHERAQSELEEIYGRISDAVFALDEEWRFTYLNERAHDLINPDGRTLVGETVWESFPDAVDRQFKPKYERAMYEQEPVSFEEYYPEPVDAWFDVQAYPSETGLSVYFRDVTERKQREQDLEETERRFEAIFEDPNILVGLLEPDGTVLDINQTAMEYVDAELADVTDEPFWETPWWGEGDDVGDDVREWTERAADGEYVDFEADLTSADGQQYTLSGYFRPVTDEDGNVVSIIVSDRDVTERKRRERELEESERRYRSLAEYFPNGLVTLYDHDLEYTLAAGQGFDRIPHEPADLEGRTVYEVWDEETAAMLAPEFETALEGEERSVELAYAGREWVVHAVPITDEHGEVFAGMTMAQDITGRTERERELARYETIVETMNDGIYVKDEDGRFTMVNEAYAELTGYDREELLGEHASLVVDEDAIQQSRAVQEASDADEASSPAMEAVIQTADGETVPAEGTFSTLETGDGEQQEVGVVRDISERKAQRRKIEQSERRYRTLVENFPNGAVGLFDEDLAYTAIGGHLMDAVGVDEEDRIGSSVDEVYPDDVAEQLRPNFEAALDGERNVFEVDYHDSHLRATTLPVRDADDEVFAGMLVVQDVTERREAQQDLRESEAKFRMLAENLEEIVWMADADADEFRYINPAFETVWGLDREELYDDSLSFLEAVHADDRERVREGFTSLPEREFDEEFRIVRPDGEVRWVRARGARVRDEDSEMIRVVGIGEDVTERKERERELERALDLLEKTERIADVGGWEIDPVTEDVFWSDHIFELLEVPGDEEPPLDEALAMYHEDDREIVETAVQEAMASGEHFDVEVRLRTAASGEVRWLRLQGVPEVEDGEVVSLRGAAQDITEQLQREQRLEELVDKLEESNERLEQFAYAASHDLQEPLRMVSSYLQLIEQRYADALDADGEEFLTYAVDGADRMREMIEGLLQYSRVDTRGDPFEPVDLDAVLEDVRDDLQVMIEEHGAQIESEPLPTVEGDGGQLRQVFQNLLENAIEYSGDEPPRVEFDADRRYAGGREEWVLSVSDEGVGVDPDDTDRVFEVFQRLQDRGESDGTGIGLALCERIVERHQGDIWMDSAPGEGTTVYFTLPATSGDDAA